jgi:hypothetical protein
MRPIKFRCGHLSTICLASPNKLSGSSALPLSDSVIGGTPDLASSPDVFTCM